LPEDNINPETTPKKTETVSSSLIAMLAVAAGVGVANVYYIQPLLPAVRESFSVTSEQVGLAPAMTQAGYAAGMLFLAPLGDLIDRTRLIVIKGLLLVVALIATAIAPDLHVLLAAGVAVGALGSIGQDFIPVAAQMAPPARRGQVVGTVTTGLLTGILLSRSLSGFIADAFGWRAAYWIAAGLVIATGLLVTRRLPASRPSERGTYGALLHSLANLIGTHAALRKALLTQALLAVTLGAFWSTLALMLAEPPFQFGAGVAGAFGFAGAAGAIGASLFGRLADSRGPNVAIRLGSIMVILAFSGMLLMPSSLSVLICGAILFDLGVMAGLVSHQAVVNALDPSARSRLNGLLMTGAMIGVALGAAIGDWAWNHHGWSGVCLTGVVAGALALLRSLLPPSK
jgi:predicted MFS family arabinose efflux permease